MFATGASGAGAAAAGAAAAVAVATGAAAAGAAATEAAAAKLLLQLSLITEIKRILSTSLPSFFKKKA